MRTCHMLCTGRINITSFSIHVGGDVATSPFTEVSSAFVIIRMFGDRPASTSFGASIQMAAQSMVGKVLSS